MGKAWLPSTDAVSTNLFYNNLDKIYFLGDNNSFDKSQKYRIKWGDIEKEKLHVLFHPHFLLFFTFSRIV